MGRGIGLPSECPFKRCSINTIILSLNETERTGDECFCGAKDSSQFAQANLNLTDKGDDMTFTKQLYAKASMALPHISARTFSRYCGKSEGYWGSIQAQKLEISTNSLLYLAQMLEHKKAQSPNRSMHELQAFITEEIARRLQALPTESVQVRRMVLKALVSTAAERDSSYNVPPIIIA